MSADPNITRVNRVPYSWTSCAHFFLGFPYKGIVAVNYKETRELQLVHAAQQDGTPLGLTSGVYKIDSFGFTMLRDTALNLMSDLSTSGLGSFGDAEFSYLLQVYEPVTPQSIPIQTLITGARVTGVEDTQEQGSDKLVTKFDCMALYLTRSYNGQALQLWSAVRSLL